MPVDFDLSGLRKSAARMSATAKEISTLEKRALGTLQRRMDVESRRQIERTTTVPQDRLRAGLLTRVKDGAVEIVGKGRGIGLINYEGAWGGRSSPGATARVNRGGAQQTERGGFIAKLPNGSRQILTRTGPKKEAQSGRYKGQKRQAIKVEYGPSIASLMEYGPRRDELTETAGEIFAAEVDRVLGTL